ncbi:hypothetical protein AB0B40_04910 [Streptomyces sp. NPDC042638]|uniref:hypothetical protein n=1 Tax=Streptomyces sp. NPDC042638 TaxID=3154333 RepID=UPI0033CA288F
MSTVPPADGSDQPPLSDEQWAAFLRDAVRRPREPSARARTRLGRLRAGVRRGLRRPARFSVRAGVQAVVPWPAAAAVVVYGAWERGLLSWARGDASPAADRLLAHDHRSAVLHPERGRRMVGVWWWGRHRGRWRQELGETVGEQCGRVAGVGRKIRGQCTVYGLGGDTAFEPGGDGRGEAAGSASGSGPGCGSAG